MEPSRLLCARAKSPVVTEALGCIATNGPLQLDFQRVDVMQVLQQNSSVLAMSAGFTSLFPTNNFSWLIAPIMFSMYLEKTCASEVFL